MRYFKAIISTILLVLIPMIMIPTLQWYKREFCEPKTELGGIYFLSVCISIGMFVLCIIRWIEAESNKDVKDI